MIFYLRKLDAGALVGGNEDDGLLQIAKLCYIDAKNFFDAKIKMVNQRNRFDDEIQQEQEENMRLDKNRRKR